MNKSSRGWDISTKRTVALIVLALLSLTLYRFRELLSPLILAGLMAFILDPVVDFLEERTRLSRSAATALTFVTVVLVILAAPVVAVPPVVDAIQSLNLDFARIVADVGEMLERPIVFLEWEFDLRSIYQQLQQSLQTFASKVAAGTVDVVVGFASTLFWLVFILLSAFYLTRDSGRIEIWLDELAPPGFGEDFARLRVQVIGVWNAFLRGQLLMAFFMMLITTVACFIVGLPRHALALGLVAGAMEFVPSIGPVIAAIPAVAVAFFEGSSWIPLSEPWFAVLVLGIYLLIQQIEGNVLLPRVLGQSLNLHPLIIFVAVIAGGNLAGVLGLLLAAPAVATLRVVGEYIYHRLTDQDPFPPVPRKPPPRRGLTRRLWDRLRRNMLAGQWVIRAARPEDRADVEAICTQIWEGTDYIPEVWEEWLGHTRGELVVVEHKGRVVAIGKLTCLADGEWWLEGLRVDPAYRHLGVAQLVQDRQVETAERVGWGTLRLATDSDNKPVHRSVIRDGFYYVTEFLCCQAVSLAGLCPLRPLTLDELDAAWELLEGSSIFQAAGGLYEVAWQWFNLTRERLADHISAKEVFRMDEKGPLAALAILPANPQAKRLTVGYLDGSVEGLTSLVWGLRALGRQRGYDELRIRVPAYEPLIETIETTGIDCERTGGLWIFERPIEKGDQDG